MTELYKKLVEYRTKLRDRENKHTPTAVISDDALKALARLKPTSFEDMLKVKGIGKAFVTKYGQGFLNVIQGESKPVKLTMMRKEVRETLKNLQARLTNVNRRNRMLYLPKELPGKAIDPSQDADKAVFTDALLSFDGKPVVLCESGAELFIQYKKLMRAAAAAQRESGANTLYVGYPFVTGKCGEGKNSFNVCAPLMLFPIKLDDAGGKIVMTTDESRDITYNNALVLCFNKFNGMASQPLPNCAVDESEITKRGFFEAVAEFYASCKMTVGRGGMSAKLAKYPSYTDKTFPKYADNCYAMQNCAIVGMFPMYSGAMQKDFDDIMEAGVMPQALTNLLEGADEIDDFYAKSTDEIDPVPADSEGNIDYINELNVSQEHAIERIDSETALVMQGPPGTGKSQTITSMISNAVCKNKNVLVVSQKRAALSVIYSRLGRLARYALFIDDPKDKDAFYTRLKSMFEAADRPAPFNSVAFMKSVNAVDGDTAALEEIGEKLTSGEYGTPLIRIYAENIDNPFKAAERDGTGADNAELYRRSVPESLLECDYEELKGACAYLDDAPLLHKLGEYYSLGERYPWLIDMKKDMSASAVAALVSELDGVLDMVAGSSRFKARRAIKAFVKANFTVYGRALIKSFRKDPVSLYNGVKAYNDFYDYKLTADSLDYTTRLYFGTLANLRRETGKPYAELVKTLLDYCGYAFIDRFETENREVMSHIANYSTIVSRICQSIDKKVLLTRDKTLNVMKTAFNSNIADSKRRGEMLRAIDGKRRPSVARFMEKFEFELFRGVRVFLMTPEAVSETLPLENDLFDILVFDEASQIYVERGIPAIARCKKLVVCGDHKQLRPSSLGDGRTTVDEDEENEAVLEEESLLDIARFKFPEVMLSYHYRSRYEELIAFSNAAFYEGKLNISPNPDRPTAPPIKVTKVNGRWEDRENRAEAEKVVELISAYLKETSDIAPKERETLGVITFNAKQRDLILDLIDKKCAVDPEFASRYGEEYSRREDGEDLGLFVKNIENVQGDERDRIIFSFAYAYNAKGVMSRNFGWLNRPGGENRLNVAISRAKRKVDIVTSIVPSDLRVDDIKTQGVHLLRKYLDYAYCVSDGDKDGAARVLESFRTVDIKTVTPTGADGGVKSLKERVCAALRDHGAAAETDVGMGNYKLDVAVKSARGDYILGIECDDSAYSDGRIATRERDVMRGKFLKSRGWKLCRVWSSDFYDNPDKVVKELLGKIGG